MKDREGNGGIILTWVLEVQVSGVDAVECPGSITQ